jgi:hypothetical protein
MMSFFRDLYKNPTVANEKAQMYHDKNNRDPILHFVSHGVLCVVYIRKKRIFSACEQVYLGICAPFASIYQMSKKR